MAARLTPVPFHEDEDSESQSLLLESPAPSRGIAAKALAGLFVLAAVAVLSATTMGGKSVSKFAEDQLIMEAEKVDPFANCSAGGDGCNATKCCQKRSDTCFEKNDAWADCKPSCKAGTFDPNSAKKWRSPWTCKVLTPEDVPCAATGTDCLMSRCCAEPGHYCYQKSPYYAGCRPNCTKGEIFSEDPKDKRIGWSCLPMDVNLTHHNITNGTNETNESTADAED